MSLRVATRYAKALIDLAAEKDSLEQVYGDMVFWQEVCGESKDLVNMLHSPVINGDKKLAVLQKVGGTHMGPITGAFVALLIRKGRESDFLEVITAFLEQYNVLKGIHTVRLTTATPVGEGIQQVVKDKLRAELSLNNVVLEAVVNEALVGGFTLEFDGKMLDASVAKDLHDIRQQFNENIYVSKIFK
jgi:F-type H+-transporting ATPase subunit delta